MNRVTVLDRQSLFDIALTLFGGIEAAYDLALQNDLSLTDQPDPGTELVYGNIGAADKKIADYYAANNINPATGIIGADDSETAHRIFDDTFDDTFE